MSRAFANRSSGSRASALNAIASSSGGHAWLNVDGGMMSPRWTFSSVWYSFLLANSGRAVSSSCSDHADGPQVAARVEILRPEIASGAMYASLPFTRPVCVRSCDDCAFAMPKSITLR